MSTQNLDDGCPSTSTAINKKAAKDRKRSSLRKGKLRKRHCTRTVRTGKPIIPPKPQLSSSGKLMVPANSQAPPSKPGKPAILPKPCLSKSKAERPIIAPKPRIPAWESGRPINQLEPHVSSHAPEANIQPMQPVTRMCPIALLTPMGFLIPRNFPSAILMNQAVTFAEDEQIHPDDPVQIGSSDSVAQTHEAHKRTNDSTISSELQKQLTDLFTSMCQIQDSSEVADYIEEENFSFPNDFKHMKYSAVMQNPRLALALKNILLEVQVIQSEAPEMMEMLEKKIGGHKENERSIRAISARFATANKASESKKVADPSTGSRMDMYRKHFAQRNDTSHRSESPKLRKDCNSAPIAETTQKTEHEVVKTAKALKERVLVAQKSEGIKWTEIEKAISTSKRPSHSKKPSSKESPTNRKDIGSSVAEKIISFSQLIHDRTHDAVEANMRTKNSKATCIHAIHKEESNKSKDSVHRSLSVSSLKFGEERERQFAAFLNSSLTNVNTDPHGPHHSNRKEFSRSFDPVLSEVGVTQSGKTPRLVGKEDCFESKQAGGNSAKASSGNLHLKSQEVHERTRAVVEDLKRKLADTQGNTTPVTQEEEVDNWDSFDSSSSLLDDEHIYEEIDEMTEVFGTRTDGDLFLHSRFSAVSSSKSTLCVEEEVLKRTPDLITTSIHNLAQTSSHEAQEDAKSGEAAKFKQKVPEERRDAKGGKLRPIIKGAKADVATANKEKQCSSTSHQSDTSVDTSSEDEESVNFCFVIGF